MEVFFKLAAELIHTTKAFWLVLLGAGIAIVAHNRTTKLTNDSNQQVRKKQQLPEILQEKQNK